MNLPSKVARFFVISYRKMVIPGSLKLITKNHSRQKKGSYDSKTWIFRAFFRVPNPLNKFTTTLVGWNGPRCICARLNQLPIWEMVGPPPLMTGILIMDTKKNATIGWMHGEARGVSTLISECCFIFASHKHPGCFIKIAKMSVEKKWGNPGIWKITWLRKWLYSSGGYNPVYS